MTLSPVALSLWVAALGAILGLPPAIGLGWVLARMRASIPRTALNTVVLLPLVLPPVVTGLLLLRLLGRRALIGGWLAELGIPVTFSVLGAVIAGLVIGLPLYVITARSAFESIDPRLEDVARSLGATEAQVLRRVTLPLATPGLLAGGVLAFARALGEFGATAVLAGDAPGRTRTISLAIYALLGSPGGDAEAFSLASISIAMSAGALLIHELLISKHRRRLGADR